MKCEICDKNPIRDNVILHRVNPFGIKGVWRCNECLTKDQKEKIDPVIKDITEIFNPKSKGLS